MERTRADVVSVCVCVCGGGGPNGDNESSHIMCPHNYKATISFS